MPPKSSMLPGDLFTCRTLVVLKLAFEFALNVPDKVCLPSLKVLRLEWIVFTDGDSIERLFSGCVVLEHLVMLECQLKNTHKFKISSRTLKRLTIDFSDEYGHIILGCAYKLVVNAPSVVYLVYHDHRYSLTNLPSLVEAHIDVVLYWKIHDEYNDAGTQFFRGISNVRSLYVSYKSMQTIQSLCRPLPVFHGMTHLEIVAEDHILAQVLPDFLKRSPNLETLVFETYYSEDFHWNPPEVVPSCLLFHLKEIKILCFEGKGVELEIVEYCLKNAKVLKKLTISGTANEKEQLQIAKKLLMLPRGSEACQVAIF